MEVNFPQSANHASLVCGSVFFFLVSTVVVLGVHCVTLDVVEL